MRISVKDSELAAASVIALLKSDSISCPNRLLHQACTGWNQQQVNTELLSLQNEASEIPRDVVQ